MTADDGLGHTSPLWRAPDGRVRAGWRILMFMGLALAVQQVLQPLVPGTLPWVTAPVMSEPSDV